MTLKVNFLMHSVVSESFAMSPFYRVGRQALCAETAVHG
jgi:hypothetical protein